ncbi:MAG: nucleotidyltransferase family protein [Prolixibacteraceae bacterium]|jgi:hypothetical protein
MTKSELFRFIGKCLALDENPGFRAELIEKCRNNEVDWNQFVGLCSNHLILPAIHLKFLSHGIVGFIPEDLAKHLSIIYELNVARNGEILTQIGQISALLSSNNIHPIFIKGAAFLIDGLLSNVGERILGDIDFLVPEKDYLQSAKILENSGYRIVETLRAYDRIESMKHYPRLEHPDFVASVEIHRIPVNVECVSWFNTELIDREKKSVESISGCFVQSDKHKIIQNFIHSQLSNEGFLFGVVSLRELNDLYLLSKRASLSESMREIKTKQKAIAYFAYSRKLLGLGESFFSLKNSAYQILSTKHTLNLNSSVFYHSLRSSIFIVQRVVNGYIGQIVLAFFSGEKRQYLYRRIKDRKWYGDHFRLYTRFFKGKK